MEEKKRIREQMLALRAALPPAEKLRHEHFIAEKLWEMVQELDAKAIHTFLPMGSEVDIFPFIDSLLKSGLTVVAPKSLKGRKLEHLVLHSLSELEAGIYGTSYPASGEVYTGSYDLFIVPGLAFDHQGNRIGYGAGYYDAFLGSQATGYRLGIGYPFQLLEALPCEPHDVRLDGVLCG
ncbi:MAG: 5-formyltetrahydrofolate cyclo-ligase [Saprospiraceae bacterium]|nr:5-formyltetrahydrofolate cyclo-ligase [Saprospiraceae bacterium]